MIGASILCVLFVLGFYAFVGFCAAVLQLVESHKAELRYRALLREPAPKKLPRKLSFQPRKDRNEYT